MFENIKNFIFFLFSLLHRSHFKNGHIYVLYVSKNSTCVVRLLLRFKAFDFFLINDDEAMKQQKTAIKMNWKISDKFQLCFVVVFYLFCKVIITTTTTTLFLKSNWAVEEGKNGAENRRGRIDDNLFIYIFLYIYIRSSHCSKKNGKIILSYKSTHWWKFTNRELYLYHKMSLICIILYLELYIMFLISFFYFCF